MVLVKDIINAIESFAPTVYQESYDNSGLQVGDPAKTRVNRPPSALKRSKLGVRTAWLP